MQNSRKTGNQPASITSLTPHFETFFKEDGKYYFQFIDAEETAIFFSRGYSSEKSRDNCIEAVRRIADDVDRYETRKDKKGQHYFVLKSGNHRQIGRSALFEREEEMMVKAALLQLIDQETTVIASVEKKAATRLKQTSKKAGLSKRTSPPKAPTPTKQEKALSIPEKSDLLPRYKFTLIYYPDSGIWTINNDFSGANKRLKSWDIELLQQFVEDQLPEEDRKNVFPAQAPQVTTPAPAKPKIDLDASAPVTTKKRNEVQFIIRTKNGEPVTQMATSKNLGSVEVAAIGHKMPTNSKFDARLIARSIDGKKDYVLGISSREKFQDNRMLIPVLGADRLTPGPYLFMLDLDQQGNADTAVKLTGRQILMVN